MNYNNKAILSLKVFILIIFCFCLLPQISLAQSTPPPPPPDTSLRGEITSKIGEVMGRLGFQVSNLPLPLVIAQGVRFVLSLVGIIFLVLIVIAGVRWMTAAGNEEQITTALKTIKNAGIGLLLIFAAYSVTYTIFLILENATRTNP